jgi:hypothetical protein
MSWLGLAAKLRRRQKESRALTHPTRTRPAAPLASQKYCWKRSVTYRDLDLATMALPVAQSQNAVECTQCQSREKHFYIATRRIWKHRSCRRQFSPTAGTIFEDSPIAVDKSPRSQALSNRHITPTGAGPPSSPQATFDPTRVELYHCSDVNLLLRPPLAAAGPYAQTDPAARSETRLSGLCPRARAHRNVEVHVRAAVLQEGGTPVSRQRLTLPPRRRSPFHPAARQAAQQRRGTA